MPESPLEVADRIFAAIQAGDVEAVRALYDPEIRVWHNFDQVEQTLDENLRVLAWMSRKVKDRRYEEVRRFETADGFVQQHILRGIAPNGERLECPAAVFCTVKDGKITRIEEYLDTAQTAVLSR
ncbi:MAG: nuclear transport factor 2 family protein [Chloroflexi bacterium]|nr:nuclear transport factor 2 family protein [Chloroflexota bacterium]